MTTYSSILLWHCLKLLGVFVFSKTMFYDFLLNMRTSFLNLVPLVRYLFVAVVAAAFMLLDGRYLFDVFFFCQLVITPVPEKWFARFIFMWTTSFFIGFDSKVEASCAVLVARIFSEYYHSESFKVISDKYNYYVDSFFSRFDIFQYQIRFIGVLYFLMALHRGWAHLLFVYLVCRVFVIYFSVAFYFTMTRIIGPYDEASRERAVIRTVTLYEALDQLL